MNNLLGPVLAIVATALLLLLREFFLSAGKKNRNSYRGGITSPAFLTRTVSASNAAARIK